MMKNIPLEYRNYDKMKEVLQDMYEQCGRRAARLILPPNWSIAGHFEYDDRRSSGEGVFCKWRVGGAEQVWHRVLRELRGDLRIDDNYSFQRATIREAAGNDEYLCCSLLAGASVAGVIATKPMSDMRANNEHLAVVAHQAPAETGAAQPMGGGEARDMSSPSVGRSSTTIVARGAADGTLAASVADPSNKKGLARRASAPQGRKRPTLASSMMSLALRIKRQQGRRDGKVAEVPPLGKHVDPTPTEVPESVGPPAPKRRRQSIADMSDEGAFVPPPAVALMA